MLTVWCRMSLPRALHLAKTSIPRISLPTTFTTAEWKIPYFTENLDHLQSVELETLLQFCQQIVYPCSTWAPHRPTRRRRTSRYGRWRSSLSGLSRPEEMEHPWSPSSSVSLAWIDAYSCLLGHTDIFQYSPKRSSFSSGENVGWRICMSHG